MPESQIKKNKSLDYSLAVTTYNTYRLRIQAAVEKFFAVTGALPQNINWAIKADYARALIPDVSTNARFNNKQEAISHTEKSVCRVIAR